MQVLDPCCGSRKFYFDKHSPFVIYGDIRDVTYTQCDGRLLEVKPDLQMDVTNLPFDDESFSLVVFDPPHLLRAGETGWLFAKYGRLNDTWKEDLRQGFAECWRCLRTGGTLIFKWNEEQIPVSEVLKLAPVKPLLGNRSGKKTHWIVFYKGLVNEF